MYRDRYTLSMLRRIYCKAPYILFRQTIISIMEKEKNERNLKKERNKKEERKKKEKLNERNKKEKRKKEKERLNE